MMKLNIDLRGLLHFGKISSGYFITTFVNTAIPLLLLPILTRYLIPEQFANIALFSFYFSLAYAFTGASIPSVISKHFFDSDKKHIANLIGNSLIIVLVFSLAAILFIIVTYPFLQKYLVLSLFWLILIPFTSFLSVSFSIGLNVLRNEKKGLLFGKHQIGNTVINIVISFVLVAVFLQGWQGRLWGIIISYFISTLLMGYYLKANGYVLFAISKNLLKSILRVFIPLIPDSFQSVIISQVGIYFIQFYFSKELLGVYAVGFQVAFAVKLLSTSLMLSWSPYLFEQLAETNSINRLYVTRMFLAVIAVMVIGMAFINIFSGIILKIVVNNTYFAAREFVPWLTIGFFFQGLYVFLMPFLIKFEKHRYISIVSFVNMIILIALNVWFVKAFGYMGIAYAFSIIYFLMFLAFAWKAQQVFPLPWLMALKIWKSNSPAV